MSLKVKVHTKGIKGSGIIKPGEDAGAMFGCLLEINGMLIEEVLEVSSHSGEDFTEVDVKLIPGSYETITHDDVSWAALTGSAPSGNGQVVRTGMGLTVARAPGGVG